jgi:hypothetical protein
MTRRKKRRGQTFTATPHGLRDRDGGLSGRVRVSYLCSGCGEITDHVHVLITEGATEVLVESPMCDRCYLAVMAYVDQAFPEVPRGSAGDDLPASCLLREPGTPGLRSVS